MAIVSVPQTRNSILSLLICIWWVVAPASNAQQAAPGTSGVRSAVPRQGGQLGTPLRARGVSDSVDALHIEGFLPRVALMDISRKADVAIGFEAVVREGDGKVAFDFPGGTVADLLNAFVAEAPEYRWQEDKGIIHVFRKGADVSLANVAMDYPGAKGATRLEIWRDLHVRPEYRNWMTVNRCVAADHKPFPKDFKFHRDPISIEPGTMTIAQLLDQVALKSGQNSWAILQVPASGPNQPCRVWINAW
ncbi:MAG: hypothetical protein WCA20_00405 [Candidatus Sulfotelmatobacter sp.]